MPSSIFQDCISLPSQGGMFQECLSPCTPGRDHRLRRQQYPTSSTRLHVGLDRIDSPARTLNVEDVEAGGFAPSDILRLRQRLGPEACAAALELKLAHLQRLQGRIGSSDRL